ncbi:GNAT family N-acetyltransferase [Pseudodesulfovibrio sp. zrk46]|uniref:GNAT family N-acetyltransferase n=1 Tax=Pseudodesulfovibrio sp. zrk46 TaxID=2725288 RepID=UPI0014494826|nr:GNAT family N-acetyltransferase [Pseudodesulfovibrio sp. zrk46]QJB56457.1 GNAT family N-acetyltransferase [Pseudodesulfovibrio sp. zrk46]
MTVEIRSLTTQEELSNCISLQKHIWGLDDLGVTSPITLKALSMADPEMSIALGGYIGEKMAGFVLIMPAMEPRTVYGHMLGVMEEHRDSGLGNMLHQTVMQRISERNVKRMFWTYEPLESRNAHVYLNKGGAILTAYRESCFEVDCDKHRGMPLDRLLTCVDLENPDIPERVESLEEALHMYPVARVDDMPSAHRVLIPIPSDLDRLKLVDFEAASRARFETRALFSEYLNRRGYIGRRLISDKTTGLQQSYYVLEREV